MRKFNVTAFLMIMILPVICYGQIDFIPPVNNGINFGQVEVGDRAQFFLSVISVPVNDIPQRISFRNANRVFSAEPSEFQIDAGAIVGVTLSFEPAQDANYQDQFSVTAVSPNGMGAISTSGSNRMGFMVSSLEIF